MLYFTGKIEAKADDKGRVFVPVAYRKRLAEAGVTRMVLRHEPGNACLVFYPESEWEKRIAELESSTTHWSANNQMLIMQYLSEAEYLEMDSQGRVLLSRPMLRSIGASKDLIFVGGINSFAVWDKNTFMASLKTDDELSAQLEALMSNSI